MTSSSPGPEMLRALESATFTSGDAVMRPEFIGQSFASGGVDARPWTDFGFQSHRGRPALKIPVDVIERMRAVLSRMPARMTDPGAAEQLANELRELAAPRARATTALLGDEE